MIKKLIKATVLGASIFAMVGTANAEVVDINIYGASAQYNYWNDAADDFLDDVMGCTDIKQAKDAAGKNGITRGLDWTDENEYYIRYSAKNSIAGIRAITGIADSPASCPGAPGSRKLADETQTNFDTGVVSATVCKDVTVGASDVEAGAFKQTTVGNKSGHLGGTYAVYQANNVSDGGKPNYRPVVVPFAFFANVGVPFDNLSQIMVAHIFAGGVDNWNDFDPTLPSLPIVRCLRHAGSGTHATFHGQIMPKGQNLPGSQIPGSAWFYESSSDIMKCPNELSGAIGYADADADTAVDANGDPLYPNVKRLDYQGFSADDENIVNGLYQFWAAQYLYVDEIQTGSPIDKLATWAADPDNMPAARDPFWSAQDEMNVGKTGTFVFPVRQ